MRSWVKLQKIQDLGALSWVAKTSMCLIFLDEAELFHVLSALVPLATAELWISPSASALPLQAQLCLPRAPGPASLYKIAHDQMRLHKSPSFSQACTTEQVAQCGVYQKAQESSQPFNFLLKQFAKISGNS